MKDVRLLGDRVRKLQQHFSQSNEDIRQVLISAEKIEKRGDRIHEVEFGGRDAAAGHAGAGAQARGRPLTILPNLRHNLTCPGAGQGRRRHEG